MEQSILPQIKKAAKKSLKARDGELASINRQLDILNGGIFADGELPYFKDKIAEIGHHPLRPNKLEILQINVGYMCNQVCEHCHVIGGQNVDKEDVFTMHYEGVHLHGLEWVFFGLCFSARLQNVCANRLISKS